MPEGETLARCVCLAMRVPVDATTLSPLMLDETSTAGNGKQAAAVKWHLETYTSRLERLLAFPGPIVHG